MSSSRDGTVRKINIATLHPCGLQSNSKASISDDKNEGSDVKHKLREAKEKHGETKYQQCNTKSDARDDLCDAHVTFNVDGSFCLDHGDCIMAMSVDANIVMTVGTDAKIKIWKMRLDEEEDKGHFRRSISGLVQQVVSLTKDHSLTLRMSAL